MQLIYFDAPWKIKFLLLIHNSFNTWAGWLDWRRNSASGLNGGSKDQNQPTQISIFLLVGFYSVWDKIILKLRFRVKSQASRSNHANAVSLSQCHGYTLTEIWACPPHICYTSQYQIYGRLKTLIWKHVFFSRTHRKSHKRIVKLLMRKPVIVEWLHYLLQNHVVLGSKPWNFGLILSI